MSTRFLSRGVSILDRVYRFVGGQVFTDRFALRSAIQPVHDLSRMAELHSQLDAFGGLVWPAVTLEHAAADTRDGTYDPFGATQTIPAWPGNSAGLEVPTDAWAWLLALGVVHDVATDPVVNVSVAYPAAGGSGLALDLPIARFGQPTRSFNASVADLVEFSDPPTLTRLPVPILNGGAVRVRSVSAAAGTSQTNLVIWVGKTGTYPPGLS